MDHEYDEIRKRITNRYNNRAEFFSHLVAFVVSNGLVWALLHPEGTWFTIVAIISGLWGMGLVIHLVQFLMKEAQEKAIEAAVAEERQWRRDGNAIPDQDMKRKRDRLTLSDDGELVEMVEVDHARSKRR